MIRLTGVEIRRLVSRRLTVIGVAAVLRIGDAGHADLHDRRMRRERIFDLARPHGEPARLDHVLPPIGDVQEAYIGILPSTEYIKLISDNEGKLQRSLFYDNVRDYQGHNQVNQEIQETIHDNKGKDKFG